MTFDELATFVAIATGGGFTQASRNLHRSQPAISRRIGQLQRRLDAPLFERIGRRVRLTDAGRALLPHAEVALAAVRDGEQAVREVLERTKGPVTLRVAIVGTLADSHLVDALRAFQAEFKDTSLELRTANSREVSALVRRGDADLGVRYFADADRGLESIPLGSEGLAVVVSADHRIRARRVASLRAFAGETWLAFPRDPRQPESGGQQLEGLLLAAGVARPKLTPIDSLTAQKRLVEAGLGIALMPRASVREELRRGTLRTIEVTNLRAEQPVVVVRRAAGRHGAAGLAFLALLQRHTPELLGRKRLTRRPRRRQLASR